MDTHTIGECRELSKKDRVDINRVEAEHFENDDSESSADDEEEVNAEEND